MEADLRRKRKRKKKVEAKKAKGKGNYNQITKKLHNKKEERDLLENSISQKRRKLKI